MKHTEYQLQGIEQRLSLANAQINAARAATPAHLRTLFTSRIRFTSAGYVWAWVLR